METRNEIIEALERNGLKQIRGSYIEYNPEGEALGACAVGQIAYNLDADPNVIANRLIQIFPGGRKCPSKGVCAWSAENANTASIIYHLNDDHHWTFGSIAKWLKKL